LQEDQKDSTFLMIGQTYSSVPLSVGYNLIFEGVTDFAISKDFATDKTIYIATKNGIYKTDNFGKTFSHYQTSIASTYITELVSDPITNTLLAVGVSFEKRADGKVLNTNLVMENEPTLVNGQHLQNLHLIM